MQTEVRRRETFVSSWGVSGDICRIASRLLLSHDSRAHGCDSFRAVSRDAGDEDAPARACRA